jgi:hypothetical protein
MSEILITTIVVTAAVDRAIMVKDDAEEAEEVGVEEAIAIVII